MAENRALKYLLKGFAEIFFIIIGVLIAVQIDTRITHNKNNKERCLYLNELHFAMASDINDVHGNIRAFETWNPKIKSIIDGIEDGSLPRVDSLADKFGTVGRYINFGQGSLSTIDELKYAQINLIIDRKLKNKLLTYQNELISFLRDRERRYDFVGEDIRKYYTKHFAGFAYEEAIPHDLSKIMKDKEYLSLVKQRYKWNKWLYGFYNHILREQKEIQKMIKEVKNKNCAED